MTGCITALRNVRGFGYRRAIVPFIPSLKNFDGIEVHFVKYLRDAFLLLGEADANSR